MSGGSLSPKRSDRGWPVLNEMGFSEFCRRSREGNMVPVYREVLADLLTPVSAFLKIGGPGSESFLLESVEGGERLARYSFLGRDPFLTVTIRDGIVTVSDPRNGTTERETGPPLEVLRRLLQRYRAARVPGLPRFTGGAVGYFAYDAVRWIERIPESTTDDLGQDDAVLNFYDTLVAFDHARRRAIVIANAHIADAQDRGGLQKAYTEARSRVNRLIADLRAPLPPLDGVQAGSPPPTVRSNLDREQFERMVEKALEHIKAGDIFQVVLSQRFQVPTTAPPFNIYRSLRAINPSPYMFYLHTNGRPVIGASPEPLVLLQDGELEYRPIAGTAPRGSTDVEDRERARAMLADEKERAEHVMLVDLGRNDLGRVAVPGSVEVADLMVVERYSHVMHLVSRLSARLEEGRDAVDALFACFPAGTVSGAPKVRAMEIIDELEPTRRGLYAGAVGYFDFAGNLDTCIALRTMMVQDGFAYIQAGAGIVADSHPDREYQETLHKARALISAVEMAGQGLD
jgi:anthranilate synthase component 1